MKPIIKDHVLYPGEERCPMRNEILLSGTPGVYQTNGGISLVFWTSAPQILGEISYKFIRPNKQLDAQYQRLYRAIYSAICGRLIALTGNIKICGPDKAAVNAVNAFAAVGFEYGFLFPRELERGCRVNYSEVPCKALEFQTLLDEALGRWDTVEILSTDPKEIENWKLFHSVLHSISDISGDNKEETCGQ